MSHYAALTEGVNGGATDVAELRVVAVVSQDLVHVQLGELEGSLVHALFLDPCEGCVLGEAR